MVRSGSPTIQTGYVLVHEYGITIERLQDPCDCCASLGVTCVFLRTRSRCDTRQCYRGDARCSLSNDELLWRVRQVHPSLTAKEFATYVGELPKPATRTSAKVNKRKRAESGCDTEEDELESGA